MQIKLVLAIATATFAGFAAAQQKCTAQNILNECLKNAKAVVDACGQTDYKCLCQTNKAMLECYINCPQDPTKGTQESLVSSWCVSAGGDATSSITSTPASSETSAPSSSGTSSGSSSEETPTESGKETSTATKEATSSNTANADDKTGAGSVASPVMAFGVVAGLAAVAGGLL
jgi:cobalamin biosynthesis Mg chelatase CobN